MAGRWLADGDDGILFRPRFPFAPGQAYSVLIYPTGPAGLGHYPEATIRRPGPDLTPVGQVESIYPSGPEIPRNHLRFYLYFSEPMSEGFAADSIELRRRDNQQVQPDALLFVGPELWDRERRRLTVLLDPGRIKRGLVPNASGGYPLRQGIDVTLSVSPAWPDAQGRALRYGLERHYAVGADSRRLVDPSRWKLSAPSAGSSEPLAVTFDRALDQALAQSGLGVVDERGDAVAGQVALAEHERGWRFTPFQPWASAQYRLVVPPRLEDTAGNSVVRLFDRDLSDRQDDPPAHPLTEITFRTISG
jgi:hypothetical protein